MIKIGKLLRGKKNSRVGQACKIPSSTKIIGPAVIGGRCQFNDDVTIGESCTIANGVKLGKHSRVERSVIWEQVTIGEGTSIIDCIIGRHSKIGRHVKIRPGTILADHANIPDYSVI